MTLVRHALELLYPSRCVFCRKVLSPEPRSICPECLATLPRNTFYPGGLYFSRCIVPLSYTGPVRDAILRYKFGDMPGYAAHFGPLLAGAIRQEAAGSYDMISWVPVSPKRLKQRGYDQAMLLAVSTAEALGESAVSTLEKTRHTSAQSGTTSAAERQSNVKDAYRAIAPHKISGKRILLIDDIITTGSTLEEASRALIDAGAAEVICAALARPSEKSKEDAI